MADLVTTGIKELYPEQSEIYYMSKYSGAAVGDVVLPDGTAKVGAVGNACGGIVLHVGSNKIAILRGGIVCGLSGLATNTLVYSDGDGTASDAEPAGAAGTLVWLLGWTISTTEMIVNITPYEKGA